MTSTKQKAKQEFGSERDMKVSPEKTSCQAMFSDTMTPTALNLSHPRKSYALKRGAALPWKDVFPCLSSCTIFFWALALAFLADGALDFPRMGISWKQDGKKSLMHQLQWSGAANGACGYKNITHGCADLHISCNVYLATYESPYLPVICSHSKEVALHGSLTKHGSLFQGKINDVHQLQEGGFVQEEKNELYRSKNYEGSSGKKLILVRFFSATKSKRSL